jgi:hypothetical protein
MCRNGLMADMPVADAAVRDLLKAEVLQPQLIARILERAVALWQQNETGHTARTARLESQIAILVPNSPISRTQPPRGGRRPRGARPARGRPLPAGGRTRRTHAVVAQEVLAASRSTRAISQVPG